MIRWLFLPVALFLFSSMGAATEKQGPRVLVIALDAVSFEIVDDLVSDGTPLELLPRLSRPIPLVSSFPSSTTLAFTGILEPLGLDRPPGYEARFYDWSRDRIRGGGLRSYGKIAFSWRDFFDWKTEGIWAKAVGYGRPEKFARREIEEALSAFETSSAASFFVYVTATDALSHLRGVEEMREFMVHLDRSLAELASRVEPFSVVLLSDHGVAGGPRLRNVRSDVRAAVRASGLRLEKRVVDDRSVVLAPFGLLSGFVLFTAEAALEGTAEAVAAAKGVDLCVRRSGERRIVVSGADGEAEIGWQEQGSGTAWSYSVTGADPLGLSEIFGDGDPGASLLGDREVFLGSLDTRYPDSLHRLRRAFDLVRHPASVICSTEEDAMFGAFVTDWSGRLTVGALRFTHGGLGRRSSLGFVMTDLPSLTESLQNAPAVRFDEVFRGWSVDR